MFPVVFGTPRPTPGCITESAEERQNVTLKVKIAPILISLTSNKEKSDNNNALNGYFGYGGKLLPMKRDPASPSAPVVHGRSIYSLERPCVVEPLTSR